MIPEFDMAEVEARRPETLAALARAAQEVGFLTLAGTGLDTARVIEAYRGFFRLPEAEKTAVDMARTGANRGWGAPKSEQVDPTANPDFKEVFDVGLALPEGHALAGQGLAVYGPNLWPEGAFRAEVEAYFAQAMEVSMALLRALAAALSGEAEAFGGAFVAPMALLRGNYYPPRPEGAGAKDFGIAPHTDYGCLTLLATDGAPGLEVETAQGWMPIQVRPGVFVINFGEMLEMWTGGRVKATPHRVIGGAAERISVPLFFNPSWDANVAPQGAQPIAAGPYLEGRFRETYLHLKEA